MSEEMSEEDFERTSTDVKKAAIVIARALQKADQPFGVCMAALAMVLVEVALECDVSRNDLMRSMEITYEMLYDEQDKLTGGDYVQ